MKKPKKKKRLDAIVNNQWGINTLCRPTRFHENPTENTSNYLNLKIVHGSSVTRITHIRSYRTKYKPKLSL